MTPAGSRRGRGWRLAGLGARLALAAWLGMGLVGAKLLTRPFPAPIPALRELDGHAVEDVAITARDGVRLSAWYSGRDAGRCAVLFAGVRGSRTTMVDRARVYLHLGWSVLLPDLRGTGASEPAPISFGWNERHDVAAAIACARERGHATVVAHGASLGAAALLYAIEDGTALDRVVLEAPYASIDSALARRLPWVPLPRWTLWPLAACTAWEIGARAADLQPARAIRACRVPTLLMAGDADRFVTAADTDWLFAACGAEAKTLHWFEGADHVDLLHAGAAEFVAKLRAFLDG